MKKTLFEISKMDCPSEENLIRMKLDNIKGIKKLDFDIENRNLTVFHEGDLQTIEKNISELNLGSRTISCEESNISVFETDTNQKKVLWAVLIINFAFFIIEISTGLISKSMGLVADSLDMLADSFVYAISLFAVGGSLAAKKRVAKTAGIFQIALALTGFAELLRRFFGEENIPDYNTMIVVSVLALSANAICLYLLQKSKSEEAHMKASMIFTSNDVIINIGVIIAALMVKWLNSPIPDLVIGSIVFVLVIQGSFRILKLSK